MKKTKTIKDLLQDFRVPVTETEWQIIVNNPKVTRYNAIRHALRVIKYPATVLIGTALIASAVVFLHHPHKTQNMPVTDNQPVQPALQPDTTATVTVTAIPTTPAFAGSQHKTSPATSISAPAPALPAKTAQTLTNSQTPPTTAKFAMQPATSTPSLDTTPKTKPSVSFGQTPPSPIQTDASKMVKTGNINITDSTGSLTFPIPEQNADIKEKLFIPSAFTPNGDGLNDMFYVKANFQPIAFDMTIFTKDGRKVFRTKDIEIGWDGQYRGHAAPQDIYLYHIRYTIPAGNVKIEKGQLLLLK